MIKISLVILLLIGLVFGARLIFSKPVLQHTDVSQVENNEIINTLTKENDLTIASLRKIYETLPTSEITLEQTLSQGTNYQRYIASYSSQENKIFGLLTVPNGTKPESGWPVIIFNHGYIPPMEYRTTERYVAYTDAFSRNGYIVFKSDYRGHGNSEGVANGSYGSNDYTIDVLSALEAIKKYPDADANKIGMWGHSMGGHITLRSMVTSKDIKAGVIWAGVVGSYEDLLNNWRRRTTPSISPLPGPRRWRDMLVTEHGTPETNPSFWNSISATSFLPDISGPLQLHHGTADTSVPYEFSVKLEERMKSVNKPVELFTYSGDDHNIANNLSSALNTSVKFFDLYLKQ